MSINLDNFCCFTGRLIKDPEITQKNSNNGQAYSEVKFTIAVKRQLTQQQKQSKQQGGQIKDSDFVSCVAYGGIADMISKYFCKGKPIRVLGSYKESTIDDQATGTKKFWHTFVISDVTFTLSDNTQNQGQQQGSTQAPQGQFSGNTGMGYADASQGFNPNCGNVQQPNTQFGAGNINQQQGYQQQNGYNNQAPQGNGQFNTGAPVGVGTPPPDMSAPQSQFANNNVAPQGQPQQGFNNNFGANTTQGFGNNNFGAGQQQTPQNFNNAGVMPGDNYNVNNIGAPGNIPQGGNVF